MSRTRDALVGFGGGILLALLALAPVLDDPIGSFSSLLVSGTSTLTGAANVNGGITSDDATDTAWGIENQNLLDKTATETVSGTWDFESTVTLDHSGASADTVTLISDIGSPYVQSIRFTHDAATNKFEIVQQDGTTDNVAFEYEDIAYFIFDPPLDTYMIGGGDATDLALGASSIVGEISGGSRIRAGSATDASVDFEIDIEDQDEDGQAEFILEATASGLFAFDVDGDGTYEARWDEWFVEFFAPSGYNSSVGGGIGGTDRMKICEWYFPSLVQADTMDIHIITGGTGTTTGGVAIYGQCDENGICTNMAESTSQDFSGTGRTAATFDGGDTMFPPGVYYVAIGSSNVGSLSLATAALGHSHFFRTRCEEVNSAGANDPPATIDITGYTFDTATSTGNAGPWWEIYNVTSESK